MSARKVNVKQSYQSTLYHKVLKQEDLRWPYNGSAALKASFFSEISFMISLIV